MKIVALTAENIKKLTAVEIRPDGNLVQITGKNGQGKTSVLDAIWWALEGAKHIQAAPIRKGATEARIRLDLGEIIVTRTFRDKEGEITTNITVENADGARFPSPQKMLDALLGELTFDPLAFTRMEQRAQFDVLRRFVPGVDFDAIQKAYDKDYQDRRDLNRRAKDLRAQEAGIAVPEDAPAERVDTQALINELDRAGGTNAELERFRAARAEAAARIERQKTKAGELLARAAALREEADKDEGQATMLARDTAEIEEKLAKAKPLPDPIDTAPIRQKIAAAESSNTRFEAAERARQERARIQREAKAQEELATACTERMEQRAKQKADAIAAAKLPVPGLGFGEGIVTMNGVPFDQASDAEQLRVSIAIAMAMNPKLRVIRVRDGSLLDEDALALIGQMADAEDYQVWVERVDSTGKVGFVLEDGHIKGAPVAQAAE